MSAKVKDVMTDEVVAVLRDASFKEMAASLHQYRVSAFPVIDENRRVIGVVSEADLLAKEALGGEHSGIPAAGPATRRCWRYRPGSLPCVGELSNSRILARPHSASDSGRLASAVRACGLRGQRRVVHWGSVRDHADSHAVSRRRSSISRHST